MKSKLIICLFLISLSRVTSNVNAQGQVNHCKKTVSMRTIEGQTKNKEAIRQLYEVILNNRQFNLLDNLISEEYANDKGGIGLTGFKKGIMEVMHAFPDAQWTINELLSEGDQVVIKQTLKGTHRGAFQNIEATGNRVTNNGFAIYTFKNGKIIHHQILTDRFTFLQQLEVLPVDVTSHLQNSADNVIFVDKFIMSNKARDEFTSRMEYNRDFIRTLPGFIKDESMIRKDTSGNISIITIAVWKNQDYLDNAKKMVQEEYKRIGFNPTELIQRLGIKMDREVYSAY